MDENQRQRIIAAEKVMEDMRLEEVASQIRAGVRSPKVCDKCGRPVAADNDVTRFDFHLGFTFAIFATPRHLLPVTENGEKVCEGSPSRAQYLPGQAKDSRLSYQYREEYESRYREAYEKMVREVMADNAFNN